MIEIRRIKLGEGMLFKAVRLAALKNSPAAFSSTYDSAKSRTSESWHEQADSCATGKDRATFIAFEEKELIGIASVYRKENSATEADVIQVWIDSNFRGTNLAKDLMENVHQWAAGNNFKTLYAEVREGNNRALNFYQKLGYETCNSHETTQINETSSLLIKILD